MRISDVLHNFILHEGKREISEMGKLHPTMLISDGFSKSQSPLWTKACVMGYNARKTQLHVKDNHQEVLNGI